MRSLGTLGWGDLCIWDEHESLGVRGWTVIGRIMALKNVQPLTLGPRDILHYMAKETLQIYLVFNFRDILIWKLPWLIWVSQSHHISP